MSTENDDEYENVPDFAPNKQAEVSQQSSQGSDSSQSQNSPPKKRARGNAQVFNLKESITSEQSVSQILGLKVLMLVFQVMTMV